MWKREKKWRKEKKEKNPEKQKSHSNFHCKHYDRDRGQ
jgi:hypothetical protein